MSQKQTMELEPTGEATLELQSSYSTSLAQKEIEAAVILAKRFPRNEEAAYQKTLHALENFNFADDAVYSYPRGKTDTGRPNMVEGPSVYLAREIGKFWGNMRYGAMILGESDEGEVPVVLGRAYAWDLETNLFESEDFRVPKLIQRKREGKTVWIAPDERDFREAFNKYGAIATRNCILRAVRNDYVRDFVEKAKAVVEKGVKDDPEKFKKKIIEAFGKLSVSVPMLEELLGHPLAQASPAEIARLREVWKSINDGNSVWTEYVPAKPSTSGGTIGLESLKASASQEPPPEHGKKGLKKVTEEDVDRAAIEHRRKRTAGESSATAASPGEGKAPTVAEPPQQPPSPVPSETEEGPTEEEMDAGLNAALEEEEKPGPQRSRRAGAFDFGGRG